MQMKACRYVLRCAALCCGALCRSVCVAACMRASLHACCPGSHACLNLNPFLLLSIRVPAQVPRPPHWGGFLLRPLSVEFWQVCGCTAGRPPLHLYCGRVRKQPQGAAMQNNHVLCSHAVHSHPAHVRRAAPPACTTACATCAPAWTPANGGWSGWRPEAAAQGSDGWLRTQQCLEWLSKEVWQ